VSGESVKKVVSEGRERCGSKEKKSKKSVYEVCGCEKRRKKRERKKERKRVCVKK
jgi:hypothetical protein